jgi:hypothetical protein
LEHRVVDFADLLVTAVGARRVDLMDEDEAAEMATYNISGSSWND